MNVKALTSNAQRGSKVIKTGINPPMLTPEAIAMLFPKWGTSQRAPSTDKMLSGAIPKKAVIVAPLLCRRINSMPPQPMPTAIKAASVVSR